MAPPWCCLVSHAAESAVVSLKNAQHHPAFLVSPQELVAKPRRLRAMWLPLYSDHAAWCVARLTPVSCELHLRGTTMGQCMSRGRAVTSPWPRPGTTRMPTCVDSIVPSRTGCTFCGGVGTVCGLCVSADSSRGPKWPDDETPQFHAVKTRGTDSGDKLRRIARMNIELKPRWTRGKGQRVCLVSQGLWDVTRTGATEASKLGHLQRG